MLGKKKPERVILFASTSDEDRGYYLYEMTLSTEIVHLTKGPKIPDSLKGKSFQRTTRLDTATQFPLYLEL